MIDKSQTIHGQHTYTTSGNHSPIIGTGAQVGAFDNSYRGALDNIDLQALAAELRDLRSEMKRLSSDEAEHDVALGEVAKAEAAAKAGDTEGLRTALKSAGKWALEVAEKIGVGVAIAAIKPLVTGSP